MSYPRLYDWKWQSFFLGEVAPNIWCVQILQVNSYSNIVEYNFSWRSRTRARLLQKKSYPGTTFPGEVVPNFLGTSSPGYDFAWVKDLLLKNQWAQRDEIYIKVFRHRTNASLQKSSSPGSGRGTIRDFFRSWKPLHFPLLNCIYYCSLCQGASDGM
jgi:hypothetical protein